MAISSRPYAGEEDYERIRSLTTRAFARGGLGTWCTVGDLGWWRFTDENPEAIA